MKANGGKCSLLVSTDNPVSINIERNIITSSRKENLPDSSLSFKNYFTKLCKKASQKLNALARVVVSYMDLHKQKYLWKAFIMSKFNCSSLVWIFDSRKLNNRTNEIHERVRWLAYNNNHSIFRELLENDNSMTIHYRNLHSTWNKEFNLIQYNSLKTIMLSEDCLLTKAYVKIMAFLNTSESNTSESLYCYNLLKLIKRLYCSWVSDKITLTSDVSFWQLSHALLMDENVRKGWSNFPPCKLKNNDANGS